MADNRKYYYLKLKEGFFESEEIKILESMKDGYIYSNILLKLYLRSLRNEGRLMYRNVIPYTPEILATLVGHQVGTVEKALEIPENGAEPMAALQGDLPAETKPEGKSKKAISNYSTDFEEFWSIYPRKVDKAQAYKKYKARLEDGFSHEQLLKAAKNYADQCRRDRTEDKYIKHGKTFLGESTPFLDYLPKNVPTACTETTNDDENPFRKE